MPTKTQRIEHLAKILATAEAEHVSCELDGDWHHASRYLAREVGIKVAAELLLSPEDYQRLLHRSGGWKVALLYEMGISRDSAMRWQRHRPGSTISASMALLRLAPQPYGALESAPEPLAIDRQPW